MKKQWWVCQILHEGNIPFKPVEKLIILKTEIGKVDAENHIKALLETDLHSRKNFTIIEVYKND